MGVIGSQGSRASWGAFGQSDLACGPLGLLLESQGIDLTPCVPNFGSLGGVASTRGPPPPTPRTEHFKIIAFRCRNTEILNKIIAFRCRNTEIWSQNRIQNNFFCINFELQKSI